MRLKQSLWRQALFRSVRAARSLAFWANDGMEPSLFEILGFEIADHLDPQAVAAALEGRLEPDPDDADGQLQGVGPAAQSEAVGVVVGPADLGGVLDRAGRRTEALELVGHDGHAEARAADEDGPVAVSRDDGPGGLGAVDDVVDGFSRPAAEVLEGEIAAPEILGDARLEQVAGVVGSERDLHSGLLSPPLGPAAFPAARPTSCPGAWPLRA